MDVEARRARLLALAERVEREAAEPRVLNFEIDVLCCPERYTAIQLEMAERGAPLPWLEAEAPDYVGDVNAARTLGGLLVFASEIGADGLPMVKLVFDTAATPVVEHTGIARTLELAWVAAALRGRAEMGR